MTETSNKTPLGRLLTIGFMEGTSFILLLFIAMPLKYMADMPAPVRIVGMIHGILFVAYVFALLHAAIVYKWAVMKVVIAFLLSFLPFGTFFLERFLKKQ